MKKLLFLYFLFLVLIFANYSKLYAIAVADYTVAESSPTNYGYNLNIDYIYHYKNSSAVAVDHYWLLTAAHVGDNGGSGSLVINGETYNQQDVVFHDKADLALVRFDKPFPGYYFIDGIINHKKSGFFGGTVWHELIMAGYGYNGTVSDDHFTQGSSYGVLRWGTNRGTKEKTVTINVGGSSGTRTSSCFEVSFDLSDTDYEAGGNIHDSGGGVFATNSMGRWGLAGIIVYRLVDNNDNGTGNDIVKISDYTNWIKSIIVDYDSDADFLPDWWEEKYGGDTTSMNAQTDEDSDNVSNYEEWMADTDPTNSASYFHILDWNAPTNITFVSSTNRQFCIEAHDDLTNTNESWSIIDNWFIGDDTQTTKSISASTTNRFYRIKVKLK